MSFPLHRGVNIGGWLSQRSGPMEERAAFFTRRDLERIARLGFDHVRLPIDEVQFWDEAGRRLPEAWDFLGAALDWCQAADLRAIVDLHILRSHYFNDPVKPLFTDPAAPAKFADLWRDLSRGLGGRSRDRVAYELLNEAVADDPADWNRVYVAPYRAIREAEPERTVVLGSNLWNQALTFEHLAVPEGDPNLILTFHYYNPMHITHYQAPWVKECAAYAGPVAYPGLPVPQAEFNRLAPEAQRLLAKWDRHYDPAVMAGDLLWPLAVRARTGLPLYCGEFGVIDRAPPRLRRAWLKDFVAVLEAHKIAWAVWTYKGGFGLYCLKGRPTAALAGLKAHLAPKRRRRIRATSLKRRRRGPRHGRPR
jgi:endoglucanase